MNGEWSVENKIKKMLLSSRTCRVFFPCPPKESPLQGSPFGMGKDIPLGRGLLWSGVGKGLVGFIQHLINRINPLLDSTIRPTTVDLVLTTCLITKLFPKKSSYEL